MKHVLLIAVAGLIAYSNTFYFPFQFDDYNNISGNPVIRSLGNFFLSSGGYSYNPRRFIGNVTFALNYHFGGLDVFGYHVMNLAVHVATAIFLYFLVVLTFRTPYFRDNESPQADTLTSRQARKSGSWEAGKSESLEGDKPSGQQVVKLASLQACEPVSLQGGSLIALFSALLFVSHPLQTQAVTYIVQRFASLAAMFYIFSVAMYIRGRLIVEKAKSYGRGAIGSRLWAVPVAFFSMSFLSAVFAMMTKEISFTLPIVILLYEFIFFKSSLRKKMLFLAPLLMTMLIIPISILGTHKPLGEIISDLSEKTRVQTNISRWDYFMTQMRVITTYLRLLFLPVNQNLDYDYPVYHSLLEPPVLLSFLFLAAIFGTAVYLLRKVSGKGHEVIEENERAICYGREATGEDEPDSTSPPMAHDPSPMTRYSVSSPITDDPLPITPDVASLPFAFLYRLIAFGILWFFITLSVESSFIPIADVIFEHRMYLPSAGAFVALTSGVFVFLDRTLRNRRAARKVFTGLLSLIVVVFCIGTYARNEVWRSGISLWQDVVKKSPDNARAYNNIGYIYLGEGRADEALRYFGTAIRLKPGYADAQDNAGVAFYDKGLFDAAISQFRKAVSLMPDISDFHHNLGLAYMQRGLLDDGIVEFEAAVKIRPEDYEIYNDMGVAYRQKGFVDKAIESFRRAIQLNPGYAGAHYNLGLAYRSIGMSGKAGEHLARAHLLDPGRF